MVNKDFYWLNQKSRTFLKRGYLDEGITPEQRIKDIGDYAEKLSSVEGLSEKFYKYMGRGFYSLSSPIWSNFGTNKGLPISCFSMFVPDTMHGILEKTAEVGMQTKIGGGTSGFFGALRGRGSKIKSGGASNGAVHFMQMFEATTNVVSQGSTRRGSFAAYLPIEHPDILEFLQIQDEGNPIKNMNIAICVSDKFMEEMLNGDEDKREIWTRVIEKRCASGEPYIFFSDTVNKNAPQVYKDKGLVINGSNLCSEIALSTSETESFVCDLSSINLLNWDELVLTDAIETLCLILDVVMTDFINKTEGMPFMDSARNFAINQRAIGVGVLGWHSLLQSKLIPFESFEAKMLNVTIFKTLKERTTEANKANAIKFGEPPLLKGYGLRNVTTMAIAPTTSSSHILGQPSPGIEPYNSNYFVKGLAKGDFTHKNVHLREVLKKHEKNTDEIWENILAHGGSVQQLVFLSQNERDVFKTFGEISQKEIVIQASQRQKYIDQSQSLNIMIPPSVDPKEISDLLIFGWDMGVKTFYYQKSANPSQELARSILTCKSCEG